MKKLFLVRHAKSDWNNAALQDIERPLNERGYSAAHFMSQRLQVSPDLMITSPAIRAASTALIFAKHLNYNSNNIIIKQELYDTNVKEYLSVIKKMDNACHSVMLFGHYHQRFCRFPDQ
ncbi:MAG: histidine phosphatase family protein [Bacteroidota bacterium]